MDLDALDRELTQLAAADQFSGVVRFESAGEVVFERSYGLANRTWNIPCAPRIRFDTASITKLFTAVAALQQIEAGAFALDTGVVDYLGLTDTALSPAITPYHLLTHTSGIGDDADEEAGERYEDLWVEQPNYSVLEAADHLPQFVDKPANFEPGAGVRYNNAGYVLLGLMIERATDQRYRDYVTSHVFAPAGMDRSGFFRMDVVSPMSPKASSPITDADDRITGWHRNIYSYPPIGSPDGGAHVTAEDLIRFHTALRAGQLLGPELTEAMFVAEGGVQAAAVRARTTWGSASSSRPTPPGRSCCYWKEGINVGVSGALGYYPDVDLTTAVLCNMEDAAWGPLKLIDRLVQAG